MSSLIIRDSGIVAEENYNLERKVKKAVKDSIQHEAERNFVILEPGLGPGQGEQNIAAKRLAKRAERGVEREIPKAVKDGIIGKVRRFIPSEILVAWGFMKEGFKMIAEDELDSTRFTIVFSVTWSLLLVCVFGYVFINLRRDLKKEKNRDNALSLTNVEMASHAAISVVSFALFSLTEGPALSVWNAPSYIPAILFGFFLIIQGTLSEPYRSAARRRAEAEAESDSDPNDHGSIDHQHLDQDASGSIVDSQYYEAGTSEPGATAERLQLRTRTHPSATQHCDHELAALHPNVSYSTEAPVRRSVDRKQDAQGNPRVFLTYSDYVAADELGRLTVPLRTRYAVNQGSWRQGNESQGSLGKDAELMHVDGRLQQQVRRADQGEMLNNIQATPGTQASSHVPSASSYPVMTSHVEVTSTQSPNGNTQPFGRSTPYPQVAATQGSKHLEQSNLHRESASSWSARSSSASVGADVSSQPKFGTPPSRFVYPHPQGVARQLHTASSQGSSGTIQIPGMAPQLPSAATQLPNAAPQLSSAASKVADAVTQGSGASPQLPSPAAPQISSASLQLSSVAPQLPTAVTQLPNRAPRLSGAAQHPSAATDKEAHAAPQLSAAAALQHPPTAKVMESQLNVASYPLGYQLLSGGTQCGSPPCSIGMSNEIKLTQPAAEARQDEALGSGQSWSLGPLDALDAAQPTLQPAHCNPDLVRPASIREKIRQADAAAAAVTTPQPQSKPHSKEVAVVVSPEATAADACATGLSGKSFNSGFGHGVLPNAFSNSQKLSAVSSSSGASSRSFTGAEQNRATLGSTELDSTTTTTATLGGLQDRAALNGGAHERGTLDYNIVVDSTELLDSAAAAAQGGVAKHSSALNEAAQDSVELQIEHADHYSPFESWQPAAATQQNCDSAICTSVLRSSAADSQRLGSFIQALDVSLPKGVLLNPSVPVQSLKPPSIYGSADASPARSIAPGSESHQSTNRSRSTSQSSCSRQVSKEVSHSSHLRNMYHSSLNYRRESAATAHVASE